MHYVLSVVARLALHAPCFKIGLIDDILCIIYISFASCKGLRCNVMTFAVGIRSMSLFLKGKCAFLYSVPSSMCPMLYRRRDSNTCTCNDYYSMRSYTLRSTSLITNSYSLGGRTPARLHCQGGWELQYHQRREPLGGKEFLIPLRDQRSFLVYKIGQHPLFIVTSVTFYVHP